jgi:hypothetical protein
MMVGVITWTLIYPCFWFNNGVQLTEFPKVQLEVLAPL